MPPSPATAVNDKQGVAYGQSAMPHIVAGMRQACVIPIPWLTGFQWLARREANSIGTVRLPPWFSGGLAERSQRFHTGRADGYERPRAAGVRCNTGDCRTSATYPVAGSHAAGQGRRQTNEGQAVLLRSYLNITGDHGVGRNAVLRPSAQDVRDIYNLHRRSLSSSYRAPERVRCDYADHDRVSEGLSVDGQL